jgi:hypothetical protein
MGVGASLDRKLYSFFKKGVYDGALQFDGNLRIAYTSVTGTALYINKAANTGPTIKAHCHQLAASSTLATDQVVANEFKGEFKDTIGSMDGIASHFHMAASGTGVLRAILGVAYLDSAKTLSGALATSSWLVGGAFSANVAGILSGTGVCVVGAYGEVGSCVGGTLTAAKYIASLWGNSVRGVALSSGLSALLLLTQWGAATVDYGIRIENTGTLTTGIGFSGAFVGNVIDFSGITYVPTGSAGPCLIRCGTYDVPLAHAVEAQSGLIRLYMETSADGSSYDRAVFACLKTTGTKGIIPIAGLAEVHADATGPANVKGCEFIAQLFNTGSHIPASGLMFGGWFKVTAIDGSTINASATVAPIWLDNQLYGVNATGALEYTIYSTTGGSKPKAWAGFRTTSSGWSQLIYFDSTMAALEPFVSSGCSVTVANVPYLKVLIGTQQYGIPLIAIT